VNGSDLHDNCRFNFHVREGGREGYAVDYGRLLGEEIGQVSAGWIPKPHRRPRLQHVG